MKLPGNLGMILLAIWLIIHGVLAYVPALSGVGAVMPILALVAGILLLLGR
jgi:hypothetical protein